MNFHMLWFPLSTTSNIIEAEGLKKEKNSVLLLKVYHFDGMNSLTIPKAFLEQLPSRDLRL